SCRRNSGYRLAGYRPENGNRTVQRHCRARGVRSSCRLRQECSMIRISIASPQESVPIDRGQMRPGVRTVLEGEGVGEAAISLAFVDNPTIHQLNKRYLDHDEPTDVLSFPLSEAGERKLIGELVIGAEVARDEAASRGHEVSAELALYVIH